MQRYHARVKAGFLFIKNNQNMKETPILFSTEMVKAILEGRKTQTRRVVKPQLIEDVRYAGGFYIPKKTKETSNISLSAINEGYYTSELCPYGKVGDVLWVRETWGKGDCLEYGMGGYIYAADIKNLADFKEHCGAFTWKPSMYMPKEACRLFLRITNIRVERLQDISEKDAIAEGVERCKHYPKVDGWKYYGKEKGWYQASARSSFKSLWESINGEQSWNDNPWVWVIEFERVFKS